MADTSWLFWVLLGLLFLYIFLKLTGVIKTPEWIELTPLTIIGILLLQLRNQIKSDIRTMLEPIKDSINDLKQRLSKQEGRIETILHLTSKKRKK